MNPLTLAKSSLNTIPSELYPAPASTSSPPRRSSNGTPRLTTTQLLTLHIALTRDPQQRHKSEWQVFVDTLPDFRPLHPLAWMIPNSDVERQDEFWPALEACLSESVRIKVQDVKRRFEDDLLLLRNVLKNEEPFRSQNMNALMSNEVLLWAWLNVNTRTVSMPLGLAEPQGAKWAVNNHSFIPLLDMINHSSIPHIVCPAPEPMPSSTLVQRSARNAMRPGGQNLAPGKVDLVLFAPLRGLTEGEQVTFLYGPHSNAVLFAEYGFTEIDERQASLRWPNDDIDVMPWVQRLWEENGGTEDKREALEAADLWGHCKLAANSGEPAPSVGLMATLYVLCSGDEANITPEALRAKNFSRSVKASARRLLIRLCEAVISDADDCRAELDELRPLARGDADKATGIAIVSGLLREEVVITRGVLDLAESGAAL